MVDQAGLMINIINVLGWSKWISRNRVQHTWPKNTKKFLPLLAGLEREPPHPVPFPDSSGSLQPDGVSKVFPQPDVLFSMACSGAPALRSHAEDVSGTQSA